MGYLTAISIGTAVLASALAGGYRLAGTNQAKALNLHIQEQNGQVLVTWNHGSVGDQPASLEIRDGGQAVRSLRNTELESGSLTYARQTGEVAIRLKVGDREEATSFLGSPPVSLSQEVADLNRRIAWLLTQKTARRAEIDRLEQTVARLEWIAHSPGIKNRK